MITLMLLFQRYAFEPRDAARAAATLYDAAAAPLRRRQRRHAQC